MNRYDLTRKNGQWQLVQQGTGEPLVTSQNKEEALRQSMELVRERTGSLRIHKEDGTFEEERTYPRAADPRQSPG